MEQILRGALVAGGDGTRLDIGIADGRIAEIAPQIEAEAPVLDVGGRLGGVRLHRNPHPPRQGLHPRPLPGGDGAISPRPSARWRGSSGSSRRTT